MVSPHEGICAPIHDNTTLGQLLRLVDEALREAPPLPGGGRPLRSAVPRPATDLLVRREWDGHGAVDQGGREADLGFTFTPYMWLVWTLFTASKIFDKEGEFSLEGPRFRAVTEAGYRAYVAAKPKLHAPEGHEHLQGYTYSLRFVPLEG